MNFNEGDFVRLIERGCSFFSLPDNARVSEYQQRPDGKHRLTLVREGTKERVVLQFSVLDLAWQMLGEGFLGETTESGECAPRYDIELI